LSVVSKNRCICSSP